MRKPMFVAAMSVAIALVLAGPAGAGEPGQGDGSAQLVRQAIALIVNTPGNMAAIQDKIVDAQAVPDREGVDLSLVAEAEGAFERKDMHAARLLLERSIGAQPHSGQQDPLPIGETRGTPGREMATGAETGIDVVTDELKPDRDLSATDALGLVALAALAASGAWLALRFRPRPYQHQEARP